MDAGWIETKDGALFASYHAPLGGARHCAIVLCDALGSDRMNLHLTYRALAERLAAIGFPVLRIDYAATCDSSGYPRGAHQVRLALSSLHSGCDWLRNESGASELCAFGAGLGGTFAMLLAAHRADINSLMLWSPLMKGRTYLRAAAALDALSPMNPQHRKPSDYELGDREATGFLISQASADELNALDASGLHGLALQRTLVMGKGRDAETIAAHLQKAGATLHLQGIDDFDVESLRRSATRAPEPLLDAVTTWSAANFPERATPAANMNSRTIDSDRPSGAPSIRRSAVPPSSTLLRSLTLLDSIGRTIREDTVHFGADRHIFGIVSRPVRAADTSLPSVLLINPGLNHRVGTNRNYVDWARRLAANGFLVLRFDVRGLGDSPPTLPEHLGKLYRDETVDDLRDAIDGMHGQYGPRQALLVGLCSGAYQVLQTALADARVIGIALLNPLRFQRVIGDVPKPVGAEFTHGSLAYFAHAALSPAAWRRLASGHVSLSTLSQSTALRIARGTQHRMAATIARMRGGQPGAATWLADAFLKLTWRGCRVLLLLDSNDQSVPALQAELAEDRDRLDATGRFSIEFVEDTDHIFRPLFSQELVRDILERTLAKWVEKT